VHISARADYAMRALLTLASSADATVTAETMAGAQAMPRKFLEAVLSDLRRAGLVTSQRGAVGGYRLARPAEDIAVADVLRAVDGPLADVRGLRPEQVSYEGVAEHLQTLWVAVRAALRGVLENVSLADVLSGSLPAAAQHLADSPEAWDSTWSHGGTRPS